MGGKGYVGRGRAGWMSRGSLALEQGGRRANRVFWGKSGAGEEWGGGELGLRAGEHNGWRGEPDA